MRHALLLAAACLASACTENASRPTPAAPAPQAPAAPPPAAPVAAPAEPPPAPPQPCAAGEVVRATVLGKGARPALQLEPDPGHGEAVRVSEVDLDGRGQPDLYVLFPTDFGSDGAIVQALYVHCSGDRYAPVWGPEYTLELKPLDTRTGGWRDVVRREKAGTPEAPTQKQVTLRFQGGTYQDAPPAPEQP